MSKMTKTAGPYKLFNLQFSDPAMESEFLSIKEKNVMRNFELTVSFLMLLNLLILIPAIIHHQKADIIISATGIAVLLTLFFIRNRYKHYVQYITLFVILFYNITRLILVKGQYHNAVKASLLLNGYVIASIQIITILRIISIKHKIIVILLNYGIRLGLVYGLIDSDAVNTISIVRQLATDIFLCYVFYTIERTDRAVFRSFYENREELKKFKELIADSLPQSITIIDSTTRNPFFSNKTFLDIFEPHPQEPETPYLTDSPLVKLTKNVSTENSKVQLDMLQIDDVTLREIGSSIRIPSSSSESNQARGGSRIVYLKEIIASLIQEKLLHDQAVSFPASYFFQEQRKSFEIIMKRVKWDGSDAVALILNDITYQEKLMALKMANLNKDKVIATVSHELRTPLNGIIGLLELTEKRVKDPEVIEFLSLCRDNAHLLMSLVNSILDLQQIGSGKLKLNLAQIDIRRVLNGVIKLFQFQCNQKGIYLQASVSDDIPFSIITDENRLKQVLINLVGNAIKFTTTGGIKIEVIEDFERPEHLQISVMDTGLGIKDEDKGKLFKMYGRLEDGESVNRNGVGLGLTISDALASLLNGQPGNRGIQLVSKYGEGSTFYFQILKEIKSPTQQKRTLNRANLQIETGKKSPYDLLKLHEIKNKLVKEESVDAESSSSPGNDQSSGSDTEAVYYEELITPVEVKSKIQSYMSVRTMSTPDLNFRVRSPNSPRHVELNIQDTNVPPSSTYLSISHKYSSSQVDVFKPTYKRKQTDFDTSDSPRNNSCILIVDDNPLNLLIAENLLRDFGCAIKTAIGGKEAIEKVKICNQEGQRMKAILMDCQMPVMDGFETTKILLKMMTRNEIQQVPIIGWTANNSAEDIKRCYECGMIKHLSKPASQDSLMKALTQLDDLL